MQTQSIDLDELQNIANSAHTQSIDAEDAQQLKKNIDEMLYRKDVENFMEENIEGREGEIDQSEIDQSDEISEIDLLNDTTLDQSVNIEFEKPLPKDKIVGDDSPNFQTAAESVASDEQVVAYNAKVVQDMIEYKQKLKEFFESIRTSKGYTEAKDWEKKWKVISDRLFMKENADIYGIYKLATESFINNGVLKQFIDVSSEKAPAPIVLTSKKYYQPGQKLYYIVEKTSELDKVTPKSLESIISKTT